MFANDHLLSAYFSYCNSFLAAVLSYLTVIHTVQRIFVAVQ